MTARETAARPLLLLLLGSGAGAELTEALAADWAVQVARTPAAAHAALRRGRYAVGVVCFGPGPGGACTSELAALLQAEPFLPWVALVRRADLGCDALRELVAHCCADYQHFPLQPERLRIVLGHAAGLGGLLAAGAAETDQAWRCTAPEELLGRSEPTLALKRRVRQLARVDLPVLITGETGTGKELAARAIHRLSRRGPGPFVAVNCAALPETLLQAALFGHEKGAFTGADRGRAGYLEAAHGGTVFLDEIGELPATLQVTLLRFLDDHRVDRVGSTRPVALDVRVIAATNADLGGALAAGTFRDDLYYRLRGVPMCLPALRERGADIELLARHFLGEACEAAGVVPPRLGYDAVRALYRHPWPGNVRELANCVRSALAVREGPVIHAADLGLAPPPAPADSVSLSSSRAALERRAVLDALSRSGHNVSDAARRLAVSRGTLYRLLDKYAIRLQR